MKSTCLIDELTAQKADRAMLEHRNAHKLGFLKGWNTQPIITDIGVCHSCRGRGYVSIHRSILQYPVGSFSKPSDK